MKFRLFVQDCVSLPDDKRSNRGCPGCEVSEIMLLPFLLRHPLSVGVPRPPHIVQSSYFVVPSAEQLSSCTVSAPHHDVVCADALSGGSAEVSGRAALTSASLGGTVFVELF